jgi:hypothetical protein
MKQRKTKKPVLAEPIVALANNIINKTPDASVGFSEASDMVSELWDQFDAAGATVGDLEAITGYIRWRKFEGFCETAPI